MTFGCVRRICLHDITILFIPQEKSFCYYFRIISRNILPALKNASAGAAISFWPLCRADSGPENAPFAARPPKVPIACQRPIPQFLFIICVWLKSINTVGPRLCGSSGRGHARLRLLPLRLSLPLSFSRSQHRKFPNNRKLSSSVPARAEHIRGEGGWCFFFHCLIAPLTGCWPANNTPMTCGWGGADDRGEADVFTRDVGLK